MTNLVSFIVKFVCCLTYIFVGTIHAAPSTKLPIGFVQCKLSDPAISACIRDGLQRATPYLAKGIPSLGILPNDPLRINSLAIDQGIGAVNLKFKDLDILNMKSTIIKDLVFDPKNYTLNVALVIQKPIILEGQYETNGRVIILPINGNGTCRFTLDNYKSFSVIKMKPVLKNGNTHLEIKSLDWKFTTSKMHLKMNNLFNGDKVLGDNMNIFLNENWMELLKEMQPAFERALSAAFISIAQEFFNRIPLNQIFID
uniref:Protein takeout n=1 Tax=Schizaphis graminum TaxID=13262 RepID=A0A2S2PLB2_SCHGA